jgi:hypothetical protein
MGAPAAVWAAARDVDAARQRAASAARRKAGVMGTIPASKGGGTTTTKRQVPHAGIYTVSGAISGTLDQAGGSRLKAHRTR